MTQYYINQLSHITLDKESVNENLVPIEQGEIYDDDYGAKRIQMAVHREDFDATSSDSSYLIYKAKATRWYDKINLIVGNKEIFESDNLCMKGNQCYNKCKVTLHFLNGENLDLYFNTDDEGYEYIKKNYPNMHLLNDNIIDE